MAASRSVPREKINQIALVDIHATEPNTAQICFDAINVGLIRDHNMLIIDSAFRGVNIRINPNIHESLKQNDPLHIKKGTSTL